MPGKIDAVFASPGIAIGEIVQIKDQTFNVSEVGGSIEEERARLQTAQQQAKIQIENLRHSLGQKVESNTAAIFSAHQELLDDPDLWESVNQQLLKGKSAAFAWKQAYTSQSDALLHLKNELLAARLHTSLF